MLKIISLLSIIYLIYSIKHTATICNVYTGAGCSTNPCKTTYKPDANGNCIKDFSGCVQYGIDNTTCLACEFGKSLLDDGTCSGTLNCLTYDDNNNCISCFPGFQFNSTDNTCISNNCASYDQLTKGCNDTCKIGWKSDGGFGCAPLRVTTQSWCQVFDLAKFISKSVTNWTVNCTVCIFYTRSVKPPCTPQYPGHIKNKKSKVNENNAGDEKKKNLKKETKVETKVTGQEKVETVVEKGNTEVVLKKTLERIAKQDRIQIRKDAIVIHRKYID